MPRALGEEEYWMTPRCKLTSLHPDWSTRLTVFCKAGEYASTASRKPWDGHSDCIAAKTILWYFGSLDSFLTMLLLVNHSSKARTFCFLSYFLLCLIILSKKNNFVLLSILLSLFASILFSLRPLLLWQPQLSESRTLASNETDLLSEDEEAPVSLSRTVVTKVVKTIQLP